MTWRKHPKELDLSPDDRSIVQECIRHFDGQRYELTSYVVMNDHVHVLVRPTTRTLEQVVWGWKSFTANALRRRGRAGRIWQEEYFDRIVRNEEDLMEKIEYILGNPTKRWPEILEYSWVELLVPRGAGPAARLYGSDEPTSIK